MFTNKTTSTQFFDYFGLHIQSCDNQSKQAGSIWVSEKISEIGIRMKNWKEKRTKDKCYILFLFLSFKIIIKCDTLLF